jgi:hypothetical protein
MNPGSSWSITQDPIVSEPSSTLQLLFKNLNVFLTFDPGFGLSVLDNLGSDHNQTSKYLTLVDLKNGCFFYPDTDTPTNYFFWMTLLSVEGILINALIIDYYIFGNYDFSY